MESTQPGTINPEEAKQELITGLRNAHGLEQQASKCSKAMWSGWRTIPN
jgi:hypothetical protein